MLFAGCKLPKSPSPLRDPWLRAAGPRCRTPSLPPPRWSHTTVSPPTCFCPSKRASCTISLRKPSFRHGGGQNRGGRGRIGGGGRPRGLALWLPPRHEDGPSVRQGLRVHARPRGSGPGVDRRAVRGDRPRPDGGKGVSRVRRLLGDVRAGRRREQPAGAAARRGRRETRGRGRHLFPEQPAGRVRPAGRHEARRRRGVAQPQPRGQRAAAHLQARQVEAPAVRGHGGGVDRGHRERAGRGHEAHVLRLLGPLAGAGSVCGAGVPGVRRRGAGCAVLGRLGGPGDRGPQDDPAQLLRGHLLHLRDHWPAQGRLPDPLPPLDLPLGHRPRLRVLHRLGPHLLPPPAVPRRRPGLAQHLLPRGGDLRIHAQVLGVDVLGRGEEDAGDGDAAHRGGGAVPVRRPAGAAGQGALGDQGDRRRAEAGAVETVHGPLRPPPDARMVRRLRGRRRHVPRAAGPGRDRLRRQARLPRAAQRQRPDSADRPGHRGHRPGSRDGAGGGVQAGGAGGGAGEDRPARDVAGEAHELRRVLRGHGRDGEEDQAERVQAGRRVHGHGRHNEHRPPRMGPFPRQDRGHVPLARRERLDNRRRRRALPVLGGPRGLQRVRRRGARAGRARGDGGGVPAEGALAGGAGGVHARDGEVRGGEAAELCGAAVREGGQGDRAHGHVQAAQGRVRQAGLRSRRHPGADVLVRRGEEVLRAVRAGRAPVHRGRQGQAVTVPDT